MGLRAVVLSRLHDTDDVESAPVQMCSVIIYFGFGVVPYAWTAVFMYVSTIFFALTHGIDVLSDSTSRLNDATTYTDASCSESTTNIIRRSPRTGYLHIRWKADAAGNEGEG